MNILTQTIFFVRFADRASCDIYHSFLFFSFVRLRATFILCPQLPPCRVHFFGQGENRRLSLPQWVNGPELNQSTVNHFTHLFCGFNLSLWLQARSGRGLQIQVLRLLSLGLKV